MKTSSSTRLIHRPDNHQTLQSELGKFQTRPSYFNRPRNHHRTSLSQSGCRTSIKAASTTSAQKDNFDKTSEVGTQTRSCHPPTIHYKKPRQQERQIQTKYRQMRFAITLFALSTVVNTLPARRSEASCGTHDRKAKPAMSDARLLSTMKQPLNPTARISNASIESYTSIALAIASAALPALPPLQAHTTIAGAINTTGLTTIMHYARPLEPSTTPYTRPAAIFKGKGTEAEGRIWVRERGWRRKRKQGKERPKEDVSKSTSKSRGKPGA